MSTYCLILDSIAFALFNFTATLSIDASKKGFYLYQFQGIWLDQFDKAFLPSAFIFNSWTRCVLGRSDDTSSALLILRDIFFNMERL